MTTRNAFICEGSEFTIPIIVWKGEPSLFVDLCSKKQGWTVLFAPDCNSKRAKLRFIKDLKLWKHSVEISGFPCHSAFA